MIATYPERAKTRNARRNQQVSVVVLSDDFGGPWVQVDGTAQAVLDVPEAVEPLVEYFLLDSRRAPRLGGVPAGHGAPGQVAPRVTRARRAVTREASRR